MASKVTVTGVSGPGQTVTAQVINNVNSFSIDCDNQLLMVNFNGKATNTQIDITGKTSLTLTVSSGAYSLTIA